MIESAKTNGLEPYAYLRLFFSELPRVQTLVDFDALLPRPLDRARLRDPSPTAANA